MKIGSHQASSEEELVFIHVKFAGRLQNLSTHVEAKQQFVALEQAATGVSANRKCDY